MVYIRVFIHKNACGRRKLQMPSGENCLPNAIHLFIYLFIIQETLKIDTFLLNYQEKALSMCQSDSTLAIRLSIRTYQFIIH